MEKSFKSFVKKETRKEKIEKVQTFLDKYERDITHGIYIISIVFSIIWVIFAKSYSKYETQINTITMNVNKYVNQTDTTYNLNVTFKDDQKVKDIILDKKEYNEYYTAYNKGIKSYLYKKTHWFYWICFAYLGINILVWFASND